MAENQNVFANFSITTQFIYGNSQLGAPSATGSITRRVIYDVAIPTGTDPDYDMVACKGHFVSLEVPAGEVASLDLSNFIDMNGAAVSWSNLKSVTVLHEPDSESEGTVTLDSEQAGAIPSIRTCDMPRGEGQGWGCFSGEGLFFESPNSNIVLVNTDIDHPAKVLLHMLGN